jgi:hypothetical protein
VRILLTCAILGAACLFCCGKAPAITELCPATLGPLQAASTSSTFSYDVRALTPRTVDATIVADTDAGWYAWSVGGVRLHVAQIAMRGSPSPRAAQSDPMVVEFPSPVRIHHAWIATAAAPGETIFGWGASGVVACDVPEYASRDEAPAAPAKTPPLAASVPVPARATAMAAPFSFVCAVPFAPSAVTAAVKPMLPSGAFSPGDNPAAVVIDVALDARGIPYDTWIGASSGAVPGFAQSAISAARSSEYRGAVSYCQPVKSIYLFRLDFQSS